MISTELRGNGHSGDGDDEDLAKITPVPVPKPRYSLGISNKSSNRTNSIYENFTIIQPQQMKAPVPTPRRLSKPNMTDSSPAARETIVKRENPGEIRQALFEMVNEDSNSGNENSSKPHSHNKMEQDSAVMINFADKCGKSLEEVFPPPEVQLQMPQPKVPRRKLNRVKTAASSSLSPKSQNTYNCCLM